MRLKASELSLQLFGSEGVNVIIEVVYILCTLACSLCVVLLVRQYWRNNSVFLLRCGICFFGLAISNACVCIGLLNLNLELNLCVLRGVITLLSIMVLIYGFVWDTK